MWRVPSARAAARAVHEPPLTMGPGATRPFPPNVTTGKSRSRKQLPSEGLSGAFMKTVIIFPIHYTLVTRVYYNTI